MTWRFYLVVFGFLIISISEDVRPRRDEEHQSYRNILEELRTDPITSLWTRHLLGRGKEKERRDENSCFVEVFPFSYQHELIWFSVFSRLRMYGWSAWFGGGGGPFDMPKRWKSIVRQRHNYFQGNLLTFHHRLHILHMYMYTYTVWI